MRHVDWGQVALLVAVVAPSVILHEVSHGVVANLFGDDTAKKAGRLTLNPIAHVDPFGTVLLPLLLSLSGVGAFGYAKPVPVNPRKLRNPRQHSLYVALAGPVTNITLAVIGIVVLRSFYRADARLAAITESADYLTGVARLVFWFALVNVILAVFNLLPIPPLDGSALVERVLPRSWWAGWLKWRQWGFGILLVLVFWGPLDKVFNPAVGFFLRLLR